LSDKDEEGPHLLDVVKAATVAAQLWMAVVGSKMVDPGQCWRFEEWLDGTSQPLPQPNYW